MEQIAFLLIGVVTGSTSAIMLLRFDSSWLKSFSLSGGAAILIGEFVAFSELLNITSENRSVMFVCLLGAWITTFTVVLIVLLQSFKRQETKYKIQTWEILLGDKKAIDQYYNSKFSEISKKLDDEYNFERLSKLKEDLDLQKRDIELEKARLVSLKVDADEILEKKHTICIPRKFDFPIKSDFFTLLPRYVTSISKFEYHLNSFTDTFVLSIKGMGNENRSLKTYLRGLCYYIGQYLFDWRDVRVHCRVYNKGIDGYQKYVAVHKDGADYQEELTVIPAGSGLIALASEIKRSVVYTANQDSAVETSSNHIWKDYITMIFEKYQIDNIPLLSIGVSVKHHVDHKDMLYFLSYIQIEQVIQENISKVNESMSICDVLVTGVA